MRWAHENPEAYAEIAALPPAQQNQALRAAIGYDPDRVRDELKERPFVCEDPLGAYENGDDPEDVSFP